MSPPKIAIIGAGPAGCTLARLLHLASIPVIVFEGEASPNYRSQGGTLDLHTATGLAALKEADLLDEFLKHGRYDGDTLQVTDKDLKVYFKRAGPPVQKDKPPTLMEQRPEIDRADLRRILTESLPEGVIQWGRHLTRVEAIDNGGGSSGGFGLVFSDGTSASGFDLVVGAEGAWSKTRQALTDQAPVYAGVGAIELSVPDAETTAPALHAAVNRGNLFAHADGLKLSAQQMGDGSLVVYAGMAREDPDWAAPDKCGYDSSDLEQTKKALTEGDGPFADWCDTLKDAIRLAGGGRCAARSMYVLPAGFRWEHRRGLTLIGDAAHVMSPYAGEGVNAAMADAMNLAKAIVQSTERPLPKGKSEGDVLDDGVAAFEEEMWTRVEKIVRLAEGLTKAWMFTPGVPQSVIATTTAMHARFRTPSIVHPLVTGLVHSYFFVKGLGK